MRFKESEEKAYEILYQSIGNRLDQIKKSQKEYVGDNLPNNEFNSHLIYL